MGVLYIINNNDNIKENNNDINILNTAESNQDDVIYFAKGMNKEDYLSAINYKTQIINKKKEYQKILYNFDQYLDYKELENIYYNLL